MLAPKCIHCSHTPHTRLVHCSYLASPLSRHSLRIQCSNTADALLAQCSYTARSLRTLAEQWTTLTSRNCWFRFHHVNEITKYYRAVHALPLTELGSQVVHTCSFLPHVANDCYSGPQEWENCEVFLFFVLPPDKVKHGTERRIPKNFFSSRNRSRSFGGGSNRKEQECRRWIRVPSIMQSSVLRHAPLRMQSLD